MSVLPLLLFAPALFAAVDEPPHAAQVILYLASPGHGGLDSRAVVDAVGVYTADLRFAVEMIAQDPPVLTAAPGERVTPLLRARRARFAFWCVPMPEGRAIGLYSIDAQGIVRKDVIPMNGPERPELHRAIALKIRAILKPGEDAAPPGARASAVVAAPTAAVAGPVAVAGPSPSSASPSTPALMVALDYCGRVSPLRQAVGLQGIGGFGTNSHVELVVGLEVARPGKQSVPTGSVSLLDVPLRFGGRLVDRRTRFAFGLGVFGSVHLLSASATSTDGAKADAFTAAGGGGIEVIARTPSVGRFSGEIRGWVDAIVPRTRFLLGVTPATETGRIAAGVAIGVVFPTR